MKLSLLRITWKYLQALGNMKGSMRWKWKKKSIPIARFPRQIPVNFRPKLKGKLKKLENQEIIAKIDSPQAWVSNLLMVEKHHSSTRFCLDPQNLNKAIITDVVVIPKVEEHIFKFWNKTIFALFDLKDDFFSTSIRWGKHRFV